LLGILANVHTPTLAELVDEAVVGDGLADQGGSPPVSVADNITGNSGVWRRSA
jgi:hypothetical protein